MTETVAYWFRGCMVSAKTMNLSPVHHRPEHKHLHSKINPHPAPMALLLYSFTYYVGVVCVVGLLVWRDVYLAVR